MQHTTSPISDIIKEQQFTDETVRLSLIQEDYDSLKGTILWAKEEIMNLIRSKQYDKKLFTRENIYTYLQQELSLNALEVGNIYLADGKVQKAFAYHQQWIEKTEKEWHLNKAFEDLQRICYAYQQEKRLTEYKYFGEKLLGYIKQIQKKKVHITWDLDILQWIIWHNLANEQKETTKQVQCLEKAFPLFEKHLSDEIIDDLTDIYNRLLAYYQENDLAEKEVDLLERSMLLLPYREDIVKIEVYIRLTNLYLEHNSLDKANNYSKELLALHKHAWWEKYKDDIFLLRWAYLKKVKNILHTDYIQEVINHGEKDRPISKVELIHSWLVLYNNPSPVHTLIQELLSDNNNDKAIKASVYYYLWLYYEHHAQWRNALSCYEKSIEHIETTIKGTYNTTEMIQNVYKRYYFLRQRIGESTTNQNTYTIDWTNNRVYTIS